MSWLVDKRPSFLLEITMLLILTGDIGEPLTVASSMSNDKNRDPAASPVISIKSSSFTVSGVLRARKISEGTICMRKNFPRHEKMKTETYSGYQNHKPLGNVDVIAFYVNVFEEIFSILCAFSFCLCVRRSEL